MEIGAIISDAISYPLNNVKAMLIYIALGIVAALVIGFTAGGVALTADNILAAGGIGLIGMIIALIIYLLISGYCLDIIKIGINKADDAPEIDFARQVINGIKYLIVCVVYLIIPFIIMIILSQINQTLGSIIGIILFIVFAFGLLMGICRLAKNESLGDALNIPEAIKDITKVGIVKILAIIVIFIVLTLIATLIVSLFGNLGDIGTIIGAIIQGIINVYLLFFYNRAVGLAYSDI
jgi:hypothetical protein